MHNSNFKGFVGVRAKGTNLNFGWGSIQKWGCIQANTVVGMKSPFLHGFHASDADSNHVFLCTGTMVMATDFNFSSELNGPPR